ncbi:hypothetical protein PFISCL1PPCAC_21028, partial [Pristionchus fissidentatus]
DFVGHGPFVEAMDVSDWEGRVQQPSNPPVRLKVFAGLRAAVNDVLALGTTGKLAVISDVVRDEQYEEYKVYAAIVHEADIVQGGYGTATCRFVISAQPSTQTGSEVQPAVAVVPLSTKFLVLNGTSLKVFRPSNGEDNTLTLLEMISIDFRVDWPPRFATRCPMRPLCVSPIGIGALDAFNCLMACGESRVVM